MKMLRSLLFLGLLFCLHFPLLNASPLFELGELVDVYFNGSVASRYESNVLRNEGNHDDDFVVIVSPGAELLFGNPNSMTFGNIYFREDFYFYTDNNNLDHQDANIFVEGHHRRERLILDVYGTFFQQAQNTPNANVLDKLIRSNITTSAIRAFYELSPKTNLEGAFEFKNVNYKNLLNQTLVDRYEYSIPLGAYYRFSPKLEIGPSYRFKHTDLQANRGDFNDHFFGMSIRGEITPKLTMDLHFGGAHRNINNGIDTTTFGIRAGSVWTATKKITVVGKAFRQFGAGGFGRSILNTGAYIRVDYDYSKKINAHATASYNNANYQIIEREDDSVQTELAVNYQIHHVIKLSTGYIFQDNTSDAFGASYSNHMAYLRAEIRY